MSNFLHVNGAVRIGGAVVAGIVIILGALHVSSANNFDPSASVISATAPERHYIESEDSNNDGVKDWEEALQDRFVDISSLSSTTDGTAPEPYTPPTTFTGKFSEAFFKDYMQNKMNGVDIVADPNKFIGDAVNAIEKNVQPKTHTRLELTIIPSTQESLHAFGNSFVEMLVRDASYTEDESVIFYEALKAQDPSLLAPIEPIARLYANVIEKSLRMEVPDALVPALLAFINANEANLATIDSMRISFEDPLLALGHMRHYQERKQALADSLVGFYTVFKEQGVMFDNDEPGAFFYIFE